MRTRTAIAGLVVFCQAAIAADVEFTGILVRLRQESIEVGIADGRLIDARLPNSASLNAAALAAAYKFGDEVRISCMPIRTVYDSAASLHQHLELKAIQLQRAPDAAELARTMAEMSWRPGENLLPRPDSGPPAASEPGESERVRGVNLEYAAKLPNFLADERARRYSARYDGAEWRFEDTIETEVAFNGVRATRQKIRRNGQPWNQPFAQLPGYIWTPWFGMELHPLFSSDCRTAIEAAGREDVDGQSLPAYHFASPPNGCFTAFVFKEPRREYIPARNGRFVVDDPGGHVLRFEAESSGFPQDFPMDRSIGVETWDFVKIGGESFLLPVSAEIVSLSPNGNWSRVTVEYTNHRHFEASSNLIVRGYE